MKPTLMPKQLRNSDSSSGVLFRQPSTSVCSISQVSASAPVPEQMQHSQQQVRQQKRSRSFL